MSFDVRIEMVEEDRKYFENWQHYAKIISEVARGNLGDVKVYVFGSVVEGRHTPASDIDVLIVSPKTPRRMEDRAKIAGEILRRVGVFSPFELHIVTPKEFEWCRRFVKRMVEV
ncbi:nucleotidyltransferase domain-containing protein [Geoglobus ahangari]